MRPTRDPLGHGASASGGSSSPFPAQSRARESVFGLSIVRPTLLTATSGASFASPSGYASLTSDRPGRPHIQTSTFHGALGSGSFAGAGGLMGAGFMSGPAADAAVGSTSLMPKPRLDRPSSATGGAVSTTPTSAAGKYHFSTPHSSVGLTGGSISAAAAGGTRRTPSIGAATGLGTPSSILTHSRGRSIIGGGGLHGFASAASAEEEASAHSHMASTALSYPQVQTFAASSGAYGSNSSSSSAGVPPKETRRAPPALAAAGPYQIVSAIREQLHNLQVAASTFSASTTHSAGSLPIARSSPSHSLSLPSSAPFTTLSASASPSPSDQGSDDELSDRSPAPTGAQHGRPTSAVSAHLAERILLAASQQQQPPRSAAPAESTSLSVPSHSLNRPQPSPPSALMPPSAASPTVSALFSSASLAASPGRHSAKKIASAAASPSHGQHSGRGAAAKAATSSSASPPITIHVCDEARGLNRDFHCDRQLLVAGMNYFRSYLGGSPAGGHDEIDISVHCDVHIFQYLLSYIHWQAAAGILDVPSSRASRQSSAGVVKPTLDGSNVVSILISSDFLQMTALVHECIRFIRGELAVLLKNPHVDLTCLSDALVARLAAEFVDPEDTFTEESATDQPTSSSAGGTGTRDLLRCSSLDRQGQVTPRLWRCKLEAMINARMAHRGGEEMQECQGCGTRWWQRTNGSGASAAGQASPASSSCPSSCPAPSARRRISFHGALTAPHVPSPHWSLQKYLLALRVSGLEWHDIWWRMWAWCHRAPSACDLCGCGGLAYAHLRQCRYHEREPVWTKRTSGEPAQLLHPCCHQPALPFASASGCKSRMHAWHPKTRREQHIHEMAIQHIDQIALAGATSANANPSDLPSSASPGPNPRRSITLLSSLASGPTPSGAAKLQSQHAPAAAALASLSAHKRPRPSAGRSSGLRTHDRDRDRGGLSTDASEGDDSASGDEEWSSDEAYEDEDEDSQGDEEEDGDRFAPPRSRTMSHSSVAPADRPPNRKGHGSSLHPPVGRPVSRHPSGRESSTTAGVAGSRAESGHAGVVVSRQPKPDPLVEQALKQLRDVLPPGEFAKLSANLVASTAASMRGSSVPPSKAAPPGAKRATSASAIRVATGGRRGTLTGAGGSGPTGGARVAPAAAAKPKSILKTSPPANPAHVAGTADVPAMDTLSEFSAVWGATPTPTYAQQQQQAAAARASPSASPTRSLSLSTFSSAGASSASGPGWSAAGVGFGAPSEWLSSVGVGVSVGDPASRKKAAYQLDSLLEDDRQRMASLVAQLTQIRATPHHAPATTAQARHGTANQQQPQANRVVVVERVPSAQARRPSMR